MRVLVAGGAGYIGSVTVRKLSQAGHAVAVLDNLEKGHREAVNASLPFYQADLREPENLTPAFTAFKPEAVVHFAAYSLVGESVAEPEKYFHNNVLGGLHLLEAMRQHDCMRIVFSSTAAVYGDPEIVPIPEDSLTLPTNPYGDSKLAFEKTLLAFQRAYGFHTVALRYFNAAGAFEGLGEDHAPETHLIPILLEVAAGQREEAVVFGNDYATPDGTCIRDYIHIADLADAHVLALDFAERYSGVFNLGNGEGYSVMQVLEAVRQATGHRIPTRVGERRAGDPPRLVASSERARRELGWTPEYSKLEQIVSTAWQWKQAHPRGYED